MFVSNSGPQFSGHHIFHGTNRHMNAVLNTLNPEIAGERASQALRHAMTNNMYYMEELNRLPVEESPEPLLFQYYDQIIGITGQDVVAFKAHEKRLKEAQGEQSLPISQGDVFKSYKVEKKLSTPDFARHNLDEQIANPNHADPNRLRDEADALWRQWRLFNKKVTW